MGNKYRPSVAVLLLFMFTFLPSSCRQDLSDYCISVDVARTNRYDLWYNGAANRGVHGQLCNGTMKDSDYPYSFHNTKCRWTILDYNYLSVLPTDTTWCFDSDNEIIECEILPCYLYGPGVTDTIPRLLGETDIRRGAPVLLKYFEDAGPIGQPYYHYVTSFIECYITRAEARESYVPQRVIHSAHLRMKTIDRSINSRGFVQLGRIGCNGTTKTMMTTLNSESVLRYFNWSCGPSAELHRDCTKAKCSPKGKHVYFNKGRYPAGDFVHSETLRFYITDKTGEDGSSLKSAIETYEFFWGKQPSRDGLKYFSCESTFSGDYTPAHRKQLDTFEYKYHVAPVSVPFAANPTYTDYGFQMFEVKALTMKSVDVSRDQKVYSGTLFKLEFELNSKYETQYYQFGIKFDYIEEDGSKTYTEIGCDSRGNPYHKNASEYLEVSRTQVNNPESIYYVDDESRCSRLASALKVKYTHSLHIRIVPQISGTIKAFAKHGHSDLYVGDDIGTFAVKVYEPGTWREWTEWSSCPSSCSGLKKERTRSCSSLTSAESYKKYGSFVELEDCKSDAGVEGLTREVDHGVCWGSGDCFSRTLDVSKGISARGLFGRDVKANLLNPPSRVHGVFSTCDLYRNFTPWTGEERLRNLKGPGVKLSPTIEQEIEQDLYVPGNFTLQLALEQNINHTITWRLDLDKAGLPADYRIVNVSLFKSQTSATQCFEKNIAPCAVNIFSEKANPTECQLKAGDPSGNIWISNGEYVRADKNLTTYNYLKKLNWLLENNGRQANVTIPMPSVIEDSMGLYQPRAYIKTSNTDNDGWVPLSPLVDLKIDNTALKNIKGTNHRAMMGHYNSRHVGIEEYPRLISVDPTADHKSYAFDIRYESLLVPPEIISAGVSIGCVSQNNYPMMIHFIPFMTPSESWRPHNFNKYNFVALFDVDHTGASLSRSMRDYDIFAARFSIKHRDQVYRFFEAVRVVNITSSMHYSQVPTFRKWPQEGPVSRLLKHIIHDTYVCPNRPIDGGWTNYRLAGETGDCGRIREHHSRMCSNPFPYNGGAPCAGDHTYYTYYMSSIPCKNYGNWMEWGDWSTCEQGCGECILSRRRECDPMKVCETSSSLAQRKSFEIKTSLLKVSCAGDCTVDTDCRGMAAPAVCDGNPRRCRFLCQDSMHCANGVCADVKRWSGDTVSVCIDQCDGDHSCPQSQSCIARRCVTPCVPDDSTNSVCKVTGEFCSSINRHCTRACVEADSCRRQLGPLGTCFPIGQQTNQSECVIGCQEDEDCVSNNFSCVLGMCIHSTHKDNYGDIECEDDTSCPLNSVCSIDTNLCVDPLTVTCGDDQSCGSAAQCDGGNCRRLYNYNKTCSDNSQCGYLENCESSVCVVQQDNNGRVILPAEGCAGCDTRLSDSICNDNKCQCPTGMKLYGGLRCGDAIPPNPTNNDIQQCIDGVCLPKCFTLADCPFGHFCLNGFCRESCYGDSYSPSDDLPAAKCSQKSLVCTDNICKKKCAGSGSCFSNQKCSNGLCYDICNKDSSCPRDFTCSSGTCILSCQKSEECRQGEACNGGSCHAVCSSDSECGTDELCFLGLCSPPCQVSADCPQSMVCAGGSCTATCGDNSGCHSSVCSEGLCSSACNDSNSCGGFWSCDQNTCVLGCTSDEECHGTQKCSSQGKCLSLIGDQCTNDGDCNANDRYIINRCNMDSNTCEIDYKQGALCEFSSECGTFAICKKGRCTWPKDVDGDRLPSPTLVECKSEVNVCARLVSGGICSSDGYCGCKDGHQQLFGRCIPEISSCVSLANCPTNDICQDGTCQTLCQREDDCGFGLTCLDGGLCGFSCDSSSCPFGTICINDKCEKQCEVFMLSESTCAHSLQTCLDGICRIMATDPSDCVVGTTLRSGICVSECNKDADCLDICVVGACSSSCSSTRPCPSGYSCMSGRCFAECDVGVENVCGLDEKFQCRIGVSNSLVGTGICVYETEYPPISHKDFDNIHTDIGCDLYGGGTRSTSHCRFTNKVAATYQGSGFFVGNTLALSCLSDENCGLASLYCLGGFCTALCDDDPTSDCGSHAICANTGSSVSRACYIACEDDSKCPRQTRCGDGGNGRMCLPILNTRCRSQEECLDSTGHALYCDLVGSVCLPYENEGLPCIFASHCGLGTYCSAARVCTRIEYVSEKDRERCSEKNIAGLMYNSTTKSCSCPSSGVVYGKKCLKHEFGPGFFAVCSGDNDCPPTGTCVGSLCLKKCSRACSVGFICVQGTCQPMCKTDDECPDEVTCSFGSCTPVCADNSPTDTCGSGGKCISGSCYEYPVSDPKRCTDQGLVHYEPEEVCLYPCTLDSECPHSACAGGVCSTTCSRANPNCAEGRECVSGRCQISCQPKAGDCPGVGSTCINRLCSSSCNKESDCVGYTTCLNGHCVDRCQTDYDCTHYLSACHQGVCTHKCTVQDDCLNGYECDFAGVFKCAAACTSDVQCSIYQTCDTQKQMCVSTLGTECTTHAECGKIPLLYCSPLSRTCEPIDKEDAPCNQQNCGLNEICIRERICRLRVDWEGNPTSHPETPLGDVFKKKDPPNEDCSLDSECRDEDDVCISFHCYSLAKGGEVFRGCAVDDPLPQRLVSSDGLQMLTCESSADCDSNQLCVDCVCAAKCTSNKDCTDFQQCFLGLCMEICPQDGDCHSLSDICVDDLCRDQCDDSQNQDLAYGSCSGGVINPMCHAAAPCPPGYICEKYVCEKLCNDVDDCAQRQVCGLSTCTTECSDAGSTNCVNGTKVNTCYSHLDCGLNRYCILGVCSPKCACERNGNCDVSPCDTIGWLCDPETGGCKPRVIEQKVSEKEIIGTGCTAARDCKHYNLYCNLDTQQCVPVRPVSGGATCNQQTDVSFCGVNGECANGKCDCIRDGANRCVGSPPQPCNAALTGNTCSHGQVCDSRYDWCVCPTDSVILGQDCVDTVGAVGGSRYLQACVLHSQCPLDSSCVSGNCYPHCSGSEDCLRFPGMRCHSGLCMLSCFINSDCDVDQYCSSEGICVQRCMLGNNDMCGQEQYCVSGECQLSCLSGYECKEGTVCVKHLCVSSCIFDFDCPQACIHGLCGVSCISTSDCGVGSSCQNSKCLQKCVTDRSCPISSQVCVQGYCTTDCSPKEDGCRERCTDSTQCAQGLTCTHGICSAPCFRQIDCGEGFLCADGTCVIACTEDEDKGETPICPSHLYCEFKDGYCKTPTGDLCDSSSDCDIGSYCSGRLCRDGTHLGSKCKTEKDCGLEELCVLGVCECLRAYHGECVEYPIACASINSEISGQSYCDTRLPQSTCNPDNNWCLCEYPYQRLGDRCVAPPSEFCIDGCPYGFECRGYKCYQKCDSTVISCPRGMSCVNGYCDYTCEYDSNCNSGQMCECGYCTNICTDNTECLSGQICNQGVCREECFEWTDNTSSCATTGYTCQDGVCLKVCNQKVRCDVLPGEVDTECGCPAARATAFEDCLLYNVSCPITTFEPDGYTLIDISKAKDCNELIADSECSVDGTRCVCKQGMVQYAGAVCQQQLQGCDPDKADCPDNHNCDNGHCYKRCSTGSDCSEYTLCNPDSGLCQLICDDDKSCLGHQTCETIEGVKRVCVAKDTSVVKGVDPGCTFFGGDGEKGEACEVPTTEKCNQDGYCECIEGMRRSNKTLQCEWLMDVVCLQCPPCLAKCPDKNMRCSEESRLCMCVEGFKLDESGKSCTKDDFTVTEMNCDSTAECNLLPNSYCNERFGKCQCRKDYCYKDKYCQPDWNECEDSSCENQTTCVDLNCLQPPGTCIPNSFTRAVVTTSQDCENGDACKDMFGPNTYCFSNRCTCVAGSFLVEGQCQQTRLCTRDIDCMFGQSCEYGICTGDFITLQSAASEDQSNEEKKALVSWPAIIVASLLVIGIAATIIVAIYTKREYEKKNASEFDDKEMKSKIEFRRSSIAGKRDALQRKLSTAVTTQQADPVQVEEVQEEGVVEEELIQSEISDVEGKQMDDVEQSVKHTKSAGGSNQGNGKAKATVSKASKVSKGSKGKSTAADEQSEGAEAIENSAWSSIKPRK